MDPICSVTKNVVDGTAHGYHLSYSHIYANGEKVLCLVVIGDSTRGSVDMTQDLQTFTLKWEELKTKLPSPESLTFRAESGLWDFSVLTGSAWVHTIARSPRR
jgi:hypothetical protein